MSNQRSAQHACFGAEDMYAAVGESDNDPFGIECEGGRDGGGGRRVAYRRGRFGEGGCGCMCLGREERDAMCAEESAT